MNCKNISSFDGELVVTDADGTLWDTDVGDEFFRYQIEHGVNGITSDHWSVYQAMFMNNPAKAYSWLAQINAGLSVEKLREIADDFCRRRRKFPYFEEMKDYLANFQDKGMEIYVVSASVRWALEPFVEKMGLDRQKILAMETKVRDGIITDEPISPLPFGVGKILAVREKIGCEPKIAFGNTMGDLDMLKAAVEPVVVTSHTPKGHNLSISEKCLQRIARKNSWRIWTF